MMTDAKKIIGLTGNIATGKSVVRRMLANSGALGIDADDISHRVLYPGAPAYQSVIDAYGEGILSSQGQILRGKLGEIVFKDEEKLHQLEDIIHPWVTKAIKKRIQLAEAPLIIIEAIKLFESDLIDICDTVWVSQASEAHQLRRLKQTRHMSREQAMARITAQPPQKQKLADADIIINTEGTFKQTWKSVQQAIKRLNDTIQLDNQPSLPNIKNSNDVQLSSARQLLDTYWMEQWKSLTHTNDQAIYQRLGGQMALPLVQNNHTKSLVFWSNWGFTATLSALFPNLADESHASIVLNAFHRHAQYHQSEILFLPHQKITLEGIDLKGFGYAKQKIADISYPSWQAAAKKGALENQNEIWSKIIAQPVETLDHLRK